jgi:small subunit ribosomal protein S14
MTTSDWRKVLKQIENKPQTRARFLKHCKPKDRKFGTSTKKCVRCGRMGAHIGKYNLNLCRQCFREIAEQIGFKKYI